MMARAEEERGVKAPKRAVNPFASLWMTDTGMTIMLGLLIFGVFIVPPLVTAGAVDRLVTKAVFTLILVSGMMVLIEHPRVRVAAAAAFSVALVSQIVSMFRPTEGARLAECLVAVGALGLLASLVLVKVFSAGPITTHRVIGAVVVYLLLGLMWAEAYRLASIIDPRCMSGVDWSQIDKRTESTLVYYSFVTLTTVGFGDITPLSPVARSLTIMEALVGQLFPAILIARLVSLSLFQKK
jgi:hypothetical protein